MFIFVYFTCMTCIPTSLGYNTACQNQSTKNKITWVDFVRPAGGLVERKRAASLVRLAPILSWSCSDLWANPKTLTAGTRTSAPSATLDGRMRTRALTTLRRIPVASAAVSNGQQTFGTRVASLCPVSN